MNRHFENMNIKEMCHFMEIPFPEHLTSIGDTIIPHIALIAKHVKPGSAYIVCTDELDVAKNLNLAMKRNVSVIFIPRHVFLESGLDIDSYPVIFTENWMDALGNLYSKIRTSYQASTVAITGTVGKTTTKEFLSHILKGHKKTFCNNGNRNSFLSVSKHITEELKDNTEVYIQEIGAGTPQSIEKSAVMLKPDYFILLNVKNHHLNTYHTFDALFADKTSVDKHMPEHGVIIANYDDTGIAAHTFSHPVISFGIDTEKDVDYRAVNITETTGNLEFDIISKDMKTHISIHILGRHNVYNAMAAYILATQLSVPVKKIVSRLRQYTPVGIRQNYRNVGGYHLYVDCYNVAFDSIKAGIDSINNFELKPGAKRYAVIGGENKLGPDATALSYQFGQDIADTNIDHFFCYGRPERDEESLNIYGDGLSICQGIWDSGNKKAEFITDSDLLIQRLKDTVKCGDIVFFKGIYLLDMPYMIDMVFGSSFTAQSEHYTKDVVISKSLTKGLYFRKLPVGDKIELAGATRKHRTLRIPDKFKPYDVYHISKNAFAKRTELKRIIWGKHVMNIDSGAFQSCTSLSALHIPATVKVIKHNAFSNCISLKEVILEEGVRHLGNQAFGNCVNLKKVILPESIGHIESGAFEGCPDLILYCPAHSYAENYARDNQIKYKTI